MLINIYRREKERERETDRDKEREREGGRTAACLSYDNCQYRDIGPCVRSWHIQNATRNGEISMVSGFVQMRPPPPKSDPAIHWYLVYYRIGIRRHCVMGKAKQNILLIFVSTQEKGRRRRNMRACVYSVLQKKKERH